MSNAIRVFLTVTITVVATIAIGFLYQQIGVSGIGTALWLLIFGAALRELGGKK